MKKSATFFVVIACMLALCVSLGVFAWQTDTALAAADEGITFTAEDYYEIRKPLASIPQTYEAEIKLSSATTGSCGTVIGNYAAMVSCINLDIAEGGKPCLYYTTKDGVNKAYVFDVDLRRDEWVHLTVVTDRKNNRISCYVDGVFVGEQTFIDYSEKNLRVNFVVGGDNRKGNTMSFKGRIREVAMYRDVRTAEEILSDSIHGANLGDRNNLLALIQIKPAHDKQDIEDLSGNGYDVSYSPAWMESKQPVTDYDYSFVVIGDTQNICEDEPHNYPKIYDWILDNRESKKIAHVFGLGDITDANTQTEWDLAHNTISKLDGVIPYSLVRGNHDASYMYNKTFNNQTYKSQFGGFYREDKIESSWKAFTAGATDYLLITLDYGADDEELAWANRIVSSFPERKVIVTTHAYSYLDGTTLGEGDEVLPNDQTDNNFDPFKQYNSGEDIWNKFVSQHANIFLVMSGHISYNDIVTTQRKGVHGNTVTEMLIDPQDIDVQLGAAGLVTVLYFSADGTKIDVEYYATVKEAYYKERNQFTLTVADEVAAPHTPAEDAQWTYDDTMHTYYCADCGVREKEAHKYGAWVETEPATTKKEGTLTKTCVCGHTVTDKVAKLASKGCGSTVAGGAFGLLSLAGAALLCVKRKQK